MIKLEKIRDCMKKLEKVLEGYLACFSAEKYEIFLTRELAKVSCEKKNRIYHKITDLYDSKG